MRRLSTIVAFIGIFVGSVILDPDADVRRTEALGASVRVLFILLAVDSSNKADDAECPIYGWYRKIYSYTNENQFSFSCNKISYTARVKKANSIIFSWMV